MHRNPAALALAALLAAPLPVAAQQAALSPAQLARIDSLFVRWSSPDGPGCALGVSRGDSVVLERAWGGAQLEHGISNTPATIFEGGSVSKQFTAAAVFLLAQEGRLSLDDDVRRHVPELPDYGTPITIRHLIHHTSGLRDWGTVMSFAGWPRGTRFYTHAYVLDVLSRQRALNHTVGAEYLYSNSNYNLLAIIVERVSGQSLAQFTRARIFEPLGMTRSGWRDDYTRIVRGRAQAYGTAPGGWRLQMANENIYGNSSVLLTVGDLLKWSANFTHQRVGGGPFAAAQLTRGRLTNGRETSYAGGVFVAEYNGTREIWHDGATAGYRAFHGRYPDAGWAVALLCNAANVDPSGLGRQVVDVALGRTPPRPSGPDTVSVAVAPERLAALAGWYRSLRDDEGLRVWVDGARLRAGQNARFVARPNGDFDLPALRLRGRFEPAPEGAVARILFVNSVGDTLTFVREADPVDSTGLSAYTGTYASEEAEVTVTIGLEQGRLTVRQRPATRFDLTPLYRDGFGGQGSTLRFTRAADGRVGGFDLTSGRARRVRFVRV